jgi:hypothetical protein
VREQASRHPHDRRSGATHQPHPHFHTNPSVYPLLEGARQFSCGDTHPDYLSAFRQPQCSERRLIIWRNLSSRSSKRRTSGPHARHQQLPLVHILVRTLNFRSSLWRLLVSSSRRHRRRNYHDSRHHSLLPCLTLRASVISFRSRAWFRSRYCAS